MDSELSKYSDIINLPHHISLDRQAMSIADRAAQFSPFAALTGFEGAINETARRTDCRIELDETEKETLDERIRVLQILTERPDQIERLKQREGHERKEIPEKNDSQLEVEILFFQPDEEKAGGSYLTVKGCLKKIDRYERTLVLQDGTRIAIEEIADITGEIFCEIEDSYFGK